jgi:hypothetical protein
MNRYSTEENKHRMEAYTNIQEPAGKIDVLM